MLAHAGLQGRAGLPHAAVAESLEQPVEEDLRLTLLVAIKVVAAIGDEVREVLRERLVLHESDITVSNRQCRGRSHRRASATSRELTTTVVTLPGWETGIHRKPRDLSD